MKKKEQRAYFDKEWEDMKGHLTAFLSGAEQEHLHRFRVQVKKLRAFLVLADSEGHSPKLAKHFKPVREIFKEAGEIRNAYMNLQLAKAYKITNDAFMIGQNQLMEKAAGEFNLNGDEHLKKAKGAHKLLKEMIRPVSDLHINMYYKNQLQEISAAFAKLNFDDSLHRSRSMVKILIYNYQLTQPVLETGFNEDYLEQIQTAIGDWHDNLLATELFGSDEAKDMPLVARLKKRDAKFRKKITALANDFYNRATTVVETPVEQLS